VFPSFFFPHCRGAFGCLRKVYCFFASERTNPFFGTRFLLPRITSRVFLLCPFKFQSMSHRVGAILNLKTLLGESPFSPVFGIGEDGLAFPFNFSQTLSLNLDAFSWGDNFDRGYVPAPLCSNDLFGSFVLQFLRGNRGAMIRWSHSLGTLLSAPHNEGSVCELPSPIVGFSI